MKLRQNLEDDPEIALIEDIAAFTFDPEGYVNYAFPWESEKLPEKGPRVWQRDTLKIIGNHLSNPETRFQPLRIAVASGHGIGKSACIAFISNWALDMRPDLSRGRWRAPCNSWSTSVRVSRTQKPRPNGGKV